MIDLTRFVKTLDKKPVYVVGLGKSGLSTIKALVKAGAEVIAWDDNLEAHATAKKLKAVIESPEVVSYPKLACVVLAPGIPLTHPEPHTVVTRAQNYDIPVYGDLELLSKAGHGKKTIGITGTNGKSTTTALIGHILNKCGVKAVVGGNIGTPALDLKLNEKTDVIVLEMSSYQIDLCSSFRPDIGVLLNITPDHIDRHGSIENYAAVKAKIFDAENIAVLSVDDEFCRDIVKTLEKNERAPIVLSTQKEVDHGIFCAEGQLIDGTFEECNEIVGAFNTLPALAGVHNHQNAIAAYAVARQFDLKPEQIFEAMRSFLGLPHRQQIVKTINGVAYINDSKATNSEATAKALATYKNLYWILGGRPKDGGLEGLEKYMDRVRHAFLIGEAADEFGAWLEKHGVVHHFSKTLDRAVQDAHEQAQGERGQPGGTGVILLSPASASFDQFPNFEARGDAFIDQVEALEE